MTRYKFLDVARGIGMMLVIIAHSCGLSRYLIYYFIQLFFILSGYLYKPGRSYKESILKKAKRLLIPYFVYNAVLLVFYALMGRTAEETKLSALGILYSRACLYDTTTTATENNIFLLNISNSAMWYLTAFFMASLVYHLVIDKCLESKKFLIGCLTVLTILTMALAELPILLPWSMDIAFVGAIFMIVGTLMGRAKFFEQKWNPGLVIATFVCYVTLTTINTDLNTSIREYGLYGRWSVPFYIIIGISGSTLAIWVARLVQDTIVGKFLCYIGQNTVILLGFHILILEMFAIVVSRFIYVGGLSTPAYVLYHAVRIAVSIAGCLILQKVLDIVKAKLQARKQSC